MIQVPKPNTTGIRIITGRNPREISKQSESERILKGQDF
jgi:hypothetical protein